ncbi:MAG: hypothetical protein Q9186_000597 [Xanthomendoza sp. 1 TL-2023]
MSDFIPDSSPNLTENEDCEPWLFVKTDPHSLWHESDLPIGNDDEEDESSTESESSTSSAAHRLARTASPNAFGNLTEVDMNHVLDQEDLSDSSDLVEYIEDLRRSSRHPSAPLTSSCPQDPQIGPQARLIHHIPLDAMELIAATRWPTDSTQPTRQPFELVDVPTGYSVLSLGQQIQMDEAETSDSASNISRDERMMTHRSRQYPILLPVGQRQEFLRTDDQMILPELHALPNSVDGIQVEAVVYRTLFVSSGARVKESRSDQCQASSVYAHKVHPHIDNTYSPMPISNRFQANIIKIWPRQGIVNAHKSSWGGNPSSSQITKRLDSAEIWKLETGFQSSILWRNSANDTSSATSVGCSGYSWDGRPFLKGTSPCVITAKGGSLPSTHGQPSVGPVSNNDTGQGALHTVEAPPGIDPAAGHRVCLCTVGTQTAGAAATLCGRVWDLSMRPRSRPNLGDGGNVSPNADNGERKSKALPGWEIRVPVFMAWIPTQWSLRLSHLDPGKEKRFSRHQKRVMRELNSLLGWQPRSLSL